MLIKPHVVVLEPYVLPLMLLLESKDRNDQNYNYLSEQEAFNILGIIIQ